ncbi:Hypothetical predicted protein, partial [Mytilus galloprovincialis]
EEKFQVEITKIKALSVLSDSKPVAQNNSQFNYNMSSPKFGTFENKSLTCDYCKKNGQLMAECLDCKGRMNKITSRSPVLLGCIDVPLHRIYLKSDLITGPVILSGRPNLPVEGVTLLLGNYLARNKVVAEPIVTSEPVEDIKSPEDDAELSPACVVSRAMTRKQQNEDLQEDEFDYMDLSDPFLADIESPVCSEKALIIPSSVNKNVIMPWPDVNSHSLDRRNLFEEQKKKTKNPR